MAKRIRKRSRAFPVSVHKATGVYYHTHKGRRIYLTKDPDVALERYRQNMADIAEGRHPRWAKQPTEPDEPRRSSGPLRLREGLDLAVADKERRKNRTFHVLRKVNALFVSLCGGDLAIEELKPLHFRRLMARLEQDSKPSTIGHVVANVKAEFKWLEAEDYIKQLPKYGASFKRPEVGEIRRARKQKIAEHGERYYSPDEIRRMLDASETHLERCLVLLGVNLGFGQEDCATLAFDDIDLDGGWYKSLRPKTNIPRGGKLWPETVEALQKFIDTARPPTASDKIFAPLNAKQLGKRFVPLPERAGCKRVGVAFYGLRHSFETLAGESKDQGAIDHVMGHVESGMASDYRQKFNRQRLEDVAELVRRVVFDTH